MGEIGLMKKLLFFIILFSFSQAVAAPENEVVFVVGPHQDIGFGLGYQSSMDEYEKQLRNHIELIEFNPKIYFAMGNTYNTKYFLDKNPEYKHRLVKLTQEGKITTPALWVDFEPGWYSGEFLVRSVAYSKYWSMSTLKHTPHWAHLNDVPGITPQLAQILAKSGVYLLQVMPARFDYAFPAETPVWYGGLDGSRVIAYGSEYDAMINFSDGNLKSLIPYTQKIGQIKKIMLTAIHDEGTDAPRTERLLGYINQWNKDYAEKYNCKATLGSFDDYALYLKKEVEEKNISLPEFTGFHFPWPWAGGYSLGMLDRMSKAANLLTTTEMFALAAEQLGLGDYPHDEINSAWEAILWPPDHNWGKIRDVKRASAQKGYDIAIRLCQRALSTLAGAVKQESGQGDLVVVFNPLNWKRSEMVEVTVPLKSDYQASVVDSQGKKVPFQILSSKRGENFNYQVKMLIEARDVPGLGYRSYRIKDGVSQPRLTTDLVTGRNFIENEYYRITVDQQGRKIRVFDKKNGIDLFDDEGKYRFGILDVYTLKTALISEMTIKKVEVIQRGPLRAVLKVSGTYTYGLSIIQEFSLDHGQDQIRQCIRFGDTKLVGKRYEPLYNYFPVGKKISKDMRLGIPYGSIPYYPRSNQIKPIKFSSRSPKMGFTLTRNFPRDTPPETFGMAYDLQKWTSLGDSSYTVDVAFDNIQARSYIKPGFMATTLFAFWQSSDKIGPWNFSIRGHRGDWRAANAPRFGWEVSNPLIGVVAPAKKTGQIDLPLQMSFFDVSASGDNVVISALKRGFDRTGVVLRFFEFLDQDTTVSVRSHPMLRIPSQEVSITDMVETPIRSVKKSGNNYQIPILGFGVETMKIFSRVVTDRIPPDSISDLKVIRGTSRTIDLTWTAPGDDGKKGRATGYDLRYSSRPLNSQNWDQAVSVKNPPKPLNSGKKQQFHLDRLAPNKTYFLGIRTRDEAGSLSALSNIVFFKTESRDRILPGRIKNLSVSDSGATWVALRWSATGDDGKKGIAASYDLRYFTAPIDKTIWKKKATQAKMNLTPEEPGTQQSFTVTGLDPETKYYFAITAVDEQGNTSPISNPVFRKTGSLRKIVFQNGLSPSPSYRGVADTTLSRVNEEEENVNYGETKFLRTWMEGARIILIRFKMNQLPPDAQIFSARLRLYCYDITYQDKGTATCYSIKKDWKENEATWHLATKSRKWPAPGKGIVDKSGDYGFGPNGIIDRVELTDGGGWVEFNVKKAIADMAAKGNWGFAIEGSCNTDCGTYYYSSEYEDDPTKRPVLEISY